MELPAKSVRVGKLTYNKDFALNNLRFGFPSIKVFIKKFAKNVVKMLNYFPKYSYRFQKRQMQSFGGLMENILVLKISRPAILLPRN